MPIEPTDLNLSSKQLREKYTRREIEETLDLISHYGSVNKYVSSYQTPGARIPVPKKDPAMMDPLSSEYLGGMISNIPGSAANTLSGIWDAVSSPLDTLGALYEAGPQGLLQGLSQRYGSLDALKRTAYEDPVGLGLEAAPGVGLLGRAGSAAARATGAISASTAMKMNKAANYVANPSQMLVWTGVNGAKALSKTIGGAGLIMLEFATGMPVQSLRAMYDTGRLTERQRRIAGTNFYRNIFGDFEIGDTVSNADDLKLRNGEFPDITTEMVLERTPQILDELDQQTPYKLFRRAQKDIGGFQDEARIFGHILQVQDKFQKRIVDNQKNIIDSIRRDFVQLTSKSDVEPTLEPKIRPEVGNRIKEVLRQRMHDIGMTTEGTTVAGSPDIPINFTTQLGFSVEGTVGFGSFKNYVNSLLNADLTDPDTFLRFLIGDPDMPGRPSINALKSRFANAGAPLPQITDDIYNVFRESLNKIYNDLGQTMPNAQERGAKLNNLLDSQKKLTEIRTELSKSFKAYRTGDMDKSGAIQTWMSAIEDNTIKKGFIDEVEHYTGQSLSAPIAGLIARRVTPKSLVARGGAVSAGQSLARGIAVGGTIGGAATGGISPLMLAWLPLASPRVTGTMLATLGLRQRFVDYGTALSRAIHQHPVGKNLAEVDGFIFSMYTALDHIHRYNAQSQKEQ